MLCEAHARDLYVGVGIAQRVMCATFDSFPVPRRAAPHQIGLSRKQIDQSCLSTVLNREICFCPCCPQDGLEP
jgi:hypothetical protein